MITDPLIGGICDCNEGGINEQFLKAITLSLATSSLWNSLRSIQVIQEQTFK